MLKAGRYSRKGPWPAVRRSHKIQLISNIHIESIIHNYIILKYSQKRQLSWQLLKFLVPFSITILYYIVTETVTLLILQSALCVRSTRDLLFLVSKSHIMTQVQKLLIKISTSIFYLGAGTTLGAIK